jgi:putative phage-type endonuclease
MKLVQLTQGTPEWHAHRAQHFNASDAPAMMGCSPYKTRAELLRELHTGLSADVAPATQRIFDAGHRFEALARPLAEEIVGEELYPCVGTEGRYSASFDGLTLGGDVAFEHKSLNDGLREAFALIALVSGDDAAVGLCLPLHYRVQMEHQLMVSGAERVLFMASRWADDSAMLEGKHCWYYPNAELRADIIAGWQQLEADLCAYVPPVVQEPAKAEHMESLPAVAVRLDGALSVVGNLPTFAEALRAFIAKIPAKPATDNEFATVDAACKALKKAEEALDSAEAGALASITDVEQMRRAVADCRKLARDTRLAAEKLVERRKVEMKEQAVAAARRALDDHIATLQAELAPMRLQPVAADFAGAIKGLRSIASMQDALDTALANGKIAADAQARVIRANLATFKAQAAGLEFLFSDLQHLVHKAADDFTALLDARIAKHRADEAAKEAARQAAEAQRIAAAAQRAAAEAEARVRAEQEALARQEREAAEAAASAAAPAPVAECIASTARASGGPVDQVARFEREGAEAHIADSGAGFVRLAAAAAPTSNEPATLKLGVICERLGFTVRADFLADVLHIPHRDTDKAAKLYRESDFPLICAQLQSHISAMAELYAHRVAA